MEPCDFICENLQDDIGPMRVMHLYEPKVGLRAIVCVDNVARGPAIGGVRMVPDVTTTEVFRLARGMTFKNAAAGLKHGGGKSGIIADPTQPEEKREELIRTFARMIRNVTEYIPGPDMGTDEGSMAYVFDEIGRCVGLPRSLGGIPLDEIGATAYGCVIATEVAAPTAKIDIKGSKYVIEGFGNVGRPTAQFMDERGAILVGASDSKGAIYNPDGIDVDELVKVKAKTGKVTDYKKAEKLSKKEDVVTAECDILYPSARPDCITMDNVAGVKARLIVQGANIPATVEAEAELHKRGVLVIPDFIANAGGVICGALEYHDKSENEVFPFIKFRIEQNVKELLDRVKGGDLPRDAAINMAKERVKAAMGFRKHNL